MRILRLVLLTAVLIVLNGTTVQAQQDNSSSGCVRLESNCLADDNGPFLGVGVTYMRALWLCKFDRPQLERDLRFLSGCGFNYMRILSMVAWDRQEIAPVTFSKNGKIVDAWPDYWENLARCIDLAYDKYKIRTQITIFADAQHVMPQLLDRQKHLNEILRLCSTRKNKIILLEVANEAWQNGFEGSAGIGHLRKLGNILTEKTDILVALSAPSSGELKGLKEIYSQSRADLATWHSSRDISGFEDGWRPVLDSWDLVKGLGVPIVNNEPIGPGASVAEENDPNKLVSAAVYSYISHMPMYTFHSIAGVYGDRFEDMPGIRSFSKLKTLLPSDLPNWKSNDGLEPDAPLTIYCGDKPNVYLSENNRCIEGVIRNIGSTKDRQFVTLPIGAAKDGVRMQARKNMRIDIYNLLDGTWTQSLVLQKGQELRFKEPACCVIKGIITKYFEITRACSNY